MPQADKGQDQTDSHRLTKAYSGTLESHWNKVRMAARRRLVPQRTCQCKRSQGHSVKQWDDLRRKTWCQRDSYRLRQVAKRLHTKSQRQPDRRRTEWEREGTTKAVTHTNRVPRTPNGVQRGKESSRASKQQKERSSWGRERTQEGAREPLGERQGSDRLGLRHSHDRSCEK